MVAEHGTGRGDPGTRGLPGQFGHYRREGLGGDPGRGMDIGVAAGPLGHLRDIVAGGLRLVSIEPGGLQFHPAPVVGASQPMQPGEGPLVRFRIGMTGRSALEHVVSQIIQGGAVGIEFGQDVQLIDRIIGGQGAGLMNQ